MACRCLVRDNSLQKEKSSCHVQSRLTFSLLHLYRGAGVAATTEKVDLLMTTLRVSKPFTNLLNIAIIVV